MTPFRTRVLNIFGNYSNAISVKQIENDLVDFDRITLYRTINLFIENGLIHEILMPGEERKLALCIESCAEKHEHDHNHLHFKCESCLEVFCIPVDDFPKVKIPKFKIRHLEMQGTGICGQCR